MEQSVRPVATSTVQNAGLLPQLSQKHSLSDTMRLQHLLSVRNAVERMGEHQDEWNALKYKCDRDKPLQLLKKNPADDDDETPTFGTGGPAEPVTQAYMPWKKNATKKKYTTQGLAKYVTRHPTAIIKQCRLT